MAREEMTFQEYVNRYFGFEIDIMDISEEDEAMLAQMWLKEING